MSSAHTLGRREADEALASGRRAEAGQLLVEWAYSREDASPQEALDGYKEAAVLLEGFEDAESLQAASRTWRYIAMQYEDWEDGVQASVAWQKYSEICLRGTDLAAKLDAGVALVGASTWVGNMGDWEAGARLASRGIKCLVGYLRHYAPHAPAFKQAQPDTLKTLCEEVEASGTCRVEKLAGCRMNLSTLYFNLGMAALVKEDLDLVKTQADVALWLVLYEGEDYAHGICKLITIANLGLHPSGRCTSKTPTPSFDLYISQKPASFMASLLQVEELS